MVAFISDIRTAASAAGLTHGLYIGCGNGRNYLPLVAGGLDLTGLDISATAIAQLGAAAPDRRPRLICGDLSALPAAAKYPLVIGIQVFQHGDRAAAHAHIRAAQARVAAGGLLCLRVNAAGTDIWPDHEVTERHPDGDRTVRYLAGPKRNLSIHFFSAAQLGGLVRRPVHARPAAAAAPHVARCARAWPVVPVGSYLAQERLTAGRPGQTATGPAAPGQPRIQLVWWTSWSP